MEYLKSGLKNVLGTPQSGTQVSGAETIERLLDRVQSSTLLDDRRDACRAIKAMSKKYRVEVGAQGMDAIVHVLEMDRNDPEIIGYALDTLCHVTSPDVFEEEETSETTREKCLTLGEQFTEIFVKKPDNVSLIVGLLEEYDFRVRWPVIKLLTSLLTNKPRDLQEYILVSPMGVSRLMDLLSDSREVIRNDTLLLLTQLTKGNANIQKIVAFENAFDRLFDIISEEDYSDGGIVVEDCLLLMLNLLKNNTSNQNFFKEGSYIQKLTPFFTLPPDGTDIGWSPQKVSNIHYMLQVVRTLVSPSNPAQVCSACQKAMKACGLLEHLCEILMASGVPADILTETINSVAEVIRGNENNQEYFAHVMAPSNPPRPAVVVLLMSMVNEKQPFTLRCAVLYCFQCFLHKNEFSQAQIIQTLLPTSADVSSITVGQLLCGGLFNSDPLSNWFSSVALSHALVDSAIQKEQLLRVQLATSIGNPAVSLLQQCTNILQQGGKVQSRLGLLMLLSTWLTNCPLAVRTFLSIPSSVPFLITQVGSNERDESEELVQGVCAFLMGICVQFNDNADATFTKDALCQLLKKRIGLEVFIDKLGEVSKHEAYSRSVKQPQLNYKQSNELLFDHEFCRLFKTHETTVMNAVSPGEDRHLINGTTDSTVSAAVVTHYKELIREQDHQLKTLSQQLLQLTSEHNQTQSKLEETTSVIQQLRDQNALLKAHHSTSPPPQNEQGDKDEMYKLRQQLQEMRVHQEKLQQEIQSKDNKIQSLEEESLHSNSQTPLLLGADDNKLERLQQQLDALNLALKRRDEEIEKLKLKNTETTPIEQDTDVAEHMSHLEEEKQTLEQQLTLAENMNKQLTSEKEVVVKELALAQTELKVLQKEKNEALLEVEGIKREQEDLLVMLTDQDTRMQDYRNKLRELGEDVEDDDLGSLEDENEDDL